MKPQLDFSVLPVTCDTAKITHGSIFVACDGSRFRGIDFIKEAISKGATKIIAGVDHATALASLERRYPHIPFSYTPNPRQTLADEAAKAYKWPAKKLRFIGVTGTKGKSTTTHLLEHIFKTAGFKTALVGGISNRIAEKALPAALTTPGSDYLQAFFAACVEEKVDVVIMEVSSHALSLDRVHGIEFEAVGFSNLGQDHLDFYKTLENYLAAKLLIFDRLTPNGKAVINLDHAHGKEVSAAAHSRLSADQIITISQTDPATATLKVKENSLNGLSLEVSHQLNDILSLQAPALMGEFNAHNIAMAACIAQSFTISSANIKQALTTFKGTPGRMQVHTLQNGAKAFVDFAHNPSSMESVLKTLRPLTDNLVVLFGCGGDKDKTKRPIMAAIAAAYANHIIITEDNPRTENRLSILREIEAGIPLVFLAKTSTIQDRRQAIAAAVNKATSSASIVAILGKGHEPYQIIGTTAHHFDDFEEIQKF